MRHREAPPPPRHAEAAAERTPPSWSSSRTPSSGRTSSRRASLSCRTSGTGAKGQGQSDPLREAGKSGTTTQAWAFPVDSSGHSGPGSEAGGVGTAPGPGPGILSGGSQGHHHHAGGRSTRLGSSTKVRLTMFCSPGPRDPRPLAVGPARAPHNPQRPPARAKTGQSEGHGCLGQSGPTPTATGPPASPCFSRAIFRTPCLNSDSTWRYGMTVDSSCGRGLRSPRD